MPSKRASFYQALSVLFCLVVAIVFILSWSYSHAGPRIAIVFSGIASVLTGLQASVTVNRYYGLHDET
jgi:hypothetical protein